MKIATKHVLPVLILGVAAGVYNVMAALAPEPEKKPATSEIVAVEVIAVRAETVSLDVKTHGTVTACTETELAAEVAGRIVWVAPGLRAGGFFNAGDILIEIEAVDYHAALARAEAELATARRSLAETQARARQAEKDWQDLGGSEPAPPLTLHRPQLDQARAAVASAAAAVEQARRNLARTRVRAPYNAMVKEKLADLGQYVTPGTPLSRMFAVDAAEVRLPVTGREMAFLDLPLPGAPPGEDLPGPGVLLSTEVGAQAFTWEGRIVRTEAVVDPEHRVFHAVARVNDPYGLKTPKPAPLAIGRFVTAVIEGRILESAVRLPAHVVTGNNTVRVVDAENRIRSRKVKIVRREGDKAVVSEGVTAGDRVCATALSAASEGLAVRPVISSADPGEAP